MPTKLQDRAARKVAKRDEKKRLIAESAIEALMELGYANTSLRDIAAKSDLSLGMLHYYFEDRSDLIIYCVERYKQAFVQGMLEALEVASGREQVIEAFSEAMVESIVDHQMTHRLWYDIRTQAMFDETFQPVGEDIEAKLMLVVRTAFDKAGHSDLSNVEMHYAMIDGAFRYLMQSQLGPKRRTRDDMKAVFADLLARFL